MQMSAKPKVASHKAKKETLESVYWFVVSSTNSSFWQIEKVTGHCQVLFACSVVDSFVIWRELYSLLSFI